MSCSSFRRFVWNFFRLENEHLNNCGNFRAVRDISLKPVNTGIKDELTIEKLMDDKEGPLPKRRLANLLISGTERKPGKDTVLRNAADETINKDVLLRESSESAMDEDKLLRSECDSELDKTVLVPSNDSSLSSEDVLPQSLELGKDVLLHASSDHVKVDNVSMNDGFSDSQDVINGSLKRKGCDWDTEDVNDAKETSL